MLIIILKTHKADFLERRQSALKTTTTTTSFLSFKMYKIGGREKNLIYVNSKGLKRTEAILMDQKERICWGSVDSSAVCKTAVTKVLKDSLVPPNFEEQVTLFWNSRAHLYQQWRGKRNSTASWSRLFLWPGKAEKSTPTLPSSLKMQRNTWSNRCTEQTSHKQWGTILNDFSSKCLAHHKRRNKRNWLQNTTKLRSSKALKVPTATEPSLPPYSYN